MKVKITLVMAIFLALILGGQGSEYSTPPQPVRVSSPAMWESVIGAEELGPVTPTAFPPSPTPTPTKTPMSTPTGTPVPKAATATATVLPTAGPTEVSRVELKEETIFDRLIRPFVKEAKQRREGSLDFQRLADPALNANRINFVLFAIGEIHEPPQTEWAIIGSPHLLSLDLTNRTVAIISLTHDLRCPECELALAKNRGVPRQKIGVLRLDQAYLEAKVGSFSLLRKTIASATGLWPDYQIALSDTLLRDFVDGAFGGVEIEVPLAFEAQSFYLEQVKYPARQFEKKRYRFDGTTAVGFIKAVPKVKEGQKTYPPELENSQRLYLIVGSLAKAVSLNPIFWWNSSRLLKAGMDQKRIAFDFDPMALCLNNITEVATSLGVAALERKIKETGVPAIGKTKYIVDKSSSLDEDEAVRWVDPAVTDDEFMQADIKAGVYPPGFGVQVPYFGNPYADDLVSNYWGSVRLAVRRTLSASAKQ